MARGRSPLAAKVPAVAAADKAAAQWKEMRRRHGDDRVATDLGFVALDSSIGRQTYADGNLDASFAQSNLSEQAVAMIGDMPTVTKAAEHGVLIADVTQWGAIAVWILAWVQAMAATLDAHMDGVVDDALRWIYNRIQKKAGEGARLAIVRNDGEYALVPYNGPADEVDGIVYASLMEMGRAAANNPNLDPEAAQLKAVQIICNRIWKDARRDAARDSREESLDVLQEAGTSLLFRFNKDDRSITSATDCEVRDRDGNVVRVIPALTEVTDVPGAPEVIRTGGIEYHESHWKGDNRSAETRALSLVQRSELVQMMLADVRAGILLTDKRSGKPTKDAVLVCAVAALILDLRAMNSLQDRLQDAEHAERYRNLTPNEIAAELSEMLGQEITRYQVIKALDMLHLEEDAYWHFVHRVDGGAPLRHCHVCNPPEKEEARFSG